MFDELNEARYRQDKIGLIATADYISSTYVIIDKKGGRWKKKDFANSSLQIGEVYRDTTRVASRERVVARRPTQATV